MLGLPQRWRPIRAQQLILAKGYPYVDWQAAALTRKEKKTRKKEERKEKKKKKRKKERKRQEERRKRLQAITQVLVVT